MSEYWRVYFTIQQSNGEIFESSTNFEDEPIKASLPDLLGFAAEYVSEKTNGKIIGFRIHKAEDPDAEDLDSPTSNVDTRSFGFLFERRKASGIVKANVSDIEGRTQ